MDHVEFVSHKGGEQENFFNQFVGKSISFFFCLNRLDSVDNIEVEGGGGERNGILKSQTCHRR